MRGDSCSRRRVGPVQRTEQVQAQTHSPSASSPKPQQDTGEKALEPTSKCSSHCGPADLRLNDPTLKEGKLMLSLIHCLAHRKMLSLQLFSLQFSPSFTGLTQTSSHPEVLPNTIQYHPPWTAHLEVSHSRGLHLFPVALNTNQGAEGLMYGRRGIGETNLTAHPSLLALFSPPC